MAKFPSEEQDRFIVRMPDGMRDLLKTAAARNNRSTNAEIVARLAESLDVDQTQGNSEVWLRAVEPLATAIVQRVQGSSLGRVEALLGTVAQSLLRSGELADEDRKDLVRIISNIHDRMERVEDAADAATFDQRIAETPQDQLSTEHLRPNSKEKRTK